MTTSSGHDQVRAEIERTRSGLSSDVDALAQEASRARSPNARSARSAARSPAADTVIGSAQDSASTISGSAPSAISSATESRSPRLHCSRAGQAAPSQPVTCLGPGLMVAR